VIKGKGMMYTAWGANPFQTTPNAEEHRRVILRRSQIVKEALAQARAKSAKELVDVTYDNDYGSTYAMAYPQPEIKRTQTFMQFGHYNGIMGDVTTPWTDRNVVPYYKGTWANLRRVGSMEEFKKAITFKDRRYGA
jgi:arsenite oxidase large subunit